MLLKRVADQLPPDLAAHIPTLETANIRTTENLIFTPVQTLASFLPSLTRHDIAQLVAHAHLISSPGVISGDLEYELNTAMGAESQWHGFGIRGLNRLVDGWNGSGIVELSGVKRVGKSLLALHTVLNLLIADSLAICRWIDTEGSFNPTRAKAILEAKGIADASAILDRLVVSPCFQIEPDLFDVLDDIRRGLSREEEPGPSDRKRVKAIVIDPIASLLKDTLSSTTAQGHAAMVTIMEELAELSYSHALLTIIINTAASSLPKNDLSAFSSTTMKPSLGTAFTYCTDISLFIQDTARVFGMVDEVERDRSRLQPGLRAVVEVLKSRVSPAGRWAVFETDGTKLWDVVPPPEEDERTIRMSAGLPTGPPRPIHGPLAQTVVP